MAVIGGRAALILLRRNHTSAIISIIPPRSFIRLLTETGVCDGWLYPQFLAPDGAVSPGAITIGLLAETSYVLIISLSRGVKLTL